MGAAASTNQSTVGHANADTESTLEDLKRSLAME